MVKANFLKGMKDIAEFVGFSESTVLKHKRTFPGMPISLQSGRWIGDPDKLEAFYRDLATGQTERWVE